MLELTGVGSLLRGASILYWLVASVALFLAIKLPKMKWKKAVGVMAVIALFGYLPITQYIEAKQREAFAREAWAYFKKKCETEAGEKIYKTFTGVKSVLVVKPLPPATQNDLFDQFWYGDPYSNATPAADRGVYVAGNLIATSKSPDGKIQTGFESVEVKRGAEGDPKYQRITYSTDRRTRVISDIEKPTSNFGISWEDISTPEDRKYWVAGSRLRVIDLSNDSVVAERIGFFIEAGFGSRVGQRNPWLTARGPKTTCPPLVSRDFQDQWFVLKVLKPVEEKTNGK
jgi:hypothetical protein